MFLEAGMPKIRVPAGGFCPGLLIAAFSPGPHVSGEERAHKSQL